MPEVADKRARWAVTCGRVAAVAAVFTLVLAVMLLVNSVRLYHGDGDGQLQLVEARELTPLKAQLVDDPKNEALMLRIRELDQELRREMFRREQLSRRGAVLLVIGAVVFVGALQLALHFRRPRLPVPGIMGRWEDPRVESRVAGRAVAGVALALVGLSVVMVGGVSTGWRELAEQEAVVPEPEVKPVSPARDPEWYPTSKQWAANWWRFRGPGGLAISDLSGMPGTWNGESGENILWKVEGGLPGESSPVVWGDRVFLTGATEEKREVSCYALETGKLLWREPVVTSRGSRAEPPEVMEMTGFAAPTPVTDGRRVFAVFANGDVAGFSADGELLWTEHLGTPENMYGHGTSLTMWRNRVIVQFDQGGDGDAGKSKIVAFDAATGDTVWSEKRMVPNSWASPIVISVEGQEQIITMADPWVMAYDPATGDEIWRVTCMEGDVAPSPVYVNDLVYVVSDGACLAAIRPDGAGDVTETHVAWRLDDEDFPDMCSLLCDGPRVYMLVFGMLHALDALTGEKLWEFDIGEEFQASPMVVGGTIYMLTQDGIMIMGTADNEKFTETGRCELAEECGASPVFLPGGRILQRGKENLYLIGGNDGN